MVYLTSAWGMGETEPQCRATDTSSVAASFLQEHDEEVALQPLKNQVGGHTRLLLLNQNTICKPLNCRELDFYQNIPQDIQMFVPKFKGVIQASSNGEVTLDKRYSPSFRDQDTRQGKNSTKRKRDDVLRMRIHRNDSSLEALRSGTHLDSSPNGQYFLLLENITSRYSHPCILDLKMGTRQHGDDATAEKRSKQIAKCAATTSASLGVRLCGMQVYQADTDHYVKRDKYWGRELNEEGFKAALYRFFHNGFCLRTSVVQRVISKLEQLRRAIERQSSYRFYSCSLLLVYEGYQVEDFATHRDASPAMRRREDSSSDHLVGFMEKIGRASDACYDADTSNNSIDYNLSVSSHEEVSSQAALHRGFGEAAARGANNSTGFYPINEETVFMDPPSGLMETVVGRPVRRSYPPYVDWTLYSSSSGDEYCCPGSHTLVNSEDTSSDLDIGLGSDKLGFRRHKDRFSGHLRVSRSSYRLEDEEEEPFERGVDVPKRLRVVNEPEGVPGDPAVDVRIIDFAHTTFCHGEPTSSNSTVHQGPDCGFLTGLDSLKRLLLEILQEG
ncbi:inositol hexakisphosphate kinase 3 [Orussus abietinus]|uniref:inositol hexakisphosphate kinase 3 n=1 Tax=Orussus abietinus TaxID=222816 RepID=UPI0006256C25|nr:inositol hexakisphosphate kinase 3 [Orussus abietinus]